MKSVQILLEKKQSEKQTQPKNTVKETREGEVITFICLAGFLQRFFATLIDLFFILFLMSLIIFFKFHFSLNININDYYIIINILFLIFSCYLLIKTQGSLGKIFVKLKVVDAITYDKATTKQLIIRQLAYIVSSITIIGFFWMLFNKNKQCFHDKIANTVVIFEQHTYII